LPNAVVENNAKTAAIVTDVDTALARRLAAIAVCFKVFKTFPNPLVLSIVLIVLFMMFSPFFFFFFFSFFLLFQGGLIAALT
jgi:hypothetical protein